VSLRVLYAYAYPIPYSETYARSELSWMQVNGVDVHLWAEKQQDVPSYPQRSYETVGGSIYGVINEFQPHIVHTHRIDTAVSVARAAYAKNTPLTLRGHSVDFDEARYRGLTDLARIWLFPHFAELFRDQPNIEALPVAYDPNLAFPEEPDDRRYVVRTGFGNSNKDVDGFIEVARMCPDVSFELVLTGPYREYVATLRETATSNVNIRDSLTNEDAVAIVRRAWVCLRGHDPNAHPYGMPISIAEALGAGLPIVARGAVPTSSSRFGPERYIGDAGFTYQTNEEAASRVREIIGWPRARWNAARTQSTAQAQHYRTDVVLPRILSVWRELAQI